MAKWVIEIRFENLYPNEWNDQHVRLINQILQPLLEEFSVIVDDDNMGEDVDCYQMYVRSKLTLTALQELILSFKSKIKTKITHWVILED